MYKKPCSCWVAMSYSRCMVYRIGRLRSQKELQSLLEEISATYPVKTLQRLYDIATQQDYGFLYINLTTNPPEFYSQFTHRLHVRPSAGSSSSSSAQIPEKAQRPQPNDDQSPAP